MNSGNNADAAQGAPGYRLSPPANWTRVLCGTKKWRSLPSPPGNDSKMTWGDSHHPVVGGGAEEVQGIKFPDIIEEMNLNWI